MTVYCKIVSDNLYDAFLRDTNSRTRTGVTVTCLGQMTNWRVVHISIVRAPSVIFWHCWKLCDSYCSFFWVQDLTSSGINWHRSAASERWGPSGARAAGEEAALAARVLSVRALWAPAQAPRGPPHTSHAPRAPSPPAVSRKMRARRRQPRRLTALAPPPPAYCLDVPAQLFCDPTCKVSHMLLFNRSFIF